VGDIMTFSIAKRVAATAFAIASLGVAVPGNAAPSAPTVLKPSVVTCQPGYVYRCTPKGCFCVKA